MAEMEWHGVEDDGNRNWLGSIALLAGILIFFALGIVFFWGRSRQEDRTEAFEQAVYRGDTQAVLDQLSPALRRRVDRGVLEAWLEHVRKKRSALASQGPGLEVDLGPAGVRQFRIGPVEHRWTPRPADPAPYRSEARSALRELLAAQYDSIWLRLSPLSPLGKDRQELPRLFTQVLGAIPSNPDQQAPTKSLLRDERYHLQFLHPVVDRTGRSLVVTLDYVFAGWQGKLFDIRFAPDSAPPDAGEQRALEPNP
jgi:hypothetical protein